MLNETVSKNELSLKRVAELLNTDESTGFLSACPFSGLHSEPRESYCSSNQRGCPFPALVLALPGLLSSCPLSPPRATGLRPLGTPAAHLPALQDLALPAPVRGPQQCLLRHLLLGPVLRGWPAAYTSVHLRPCGAPPPGDSLPRGWRAGRIPGWNRV